jgi:hypothetical protein
MRLLRSATSRDDAPEASSSATTPELDSTPPLSSTTTGAATAAAATAAALAASIVGPPSLNMGPHDAVEFAVFASGLRAALLCRRLVLVRFLLYLSISFQNISVFFL